MPSFLRAGKILILFYYSLSFGHAPATSTLSALTTYDSHILKLYSGFSQYILQWSFFDRCSDATS